MTQHRYSKRDSIVASSAQIFYERGTSVSVDSLIGEIDAAKMTVYKHFPTKDELIVACLEHMDAVYRNRLERDMSTALTPEEKLSAIFDSQQRWFSTPKFRGCVFVNATVELANVDHPAHQAVLDHKHRTREWIKELVTDCGVSDPEFVAHQIAMIIEGAMITALIEHDAAAANIAKVTAGQIIAMNKVASNTP